MESEGGGEIIMVLLPWELEFRFISILGRGMDSPGWRGAKKTQWNPNGEGEVGSWNFLNSGMFKYFLRKIESSTAHERRKFLGIQNAVTQRLHGVPFLERPYGKEEKNVQEK